MQVAALVISVVALLASVFSVTIAWRSLTFEGQAADAASRSADADEIANRLTERALTDRVEGRIPADETIEERRGAQVSFQLQHTGTNTWVLRNTGTDTAHHVRVEKPNIVTRRFPTDATIKPGEGVDLLMVGGFGSPLPNQLWVTWDGQPDAVAVPLGL